MDYISKYTGKEIEDILDSVSSKAKHIFVYIDTMTPQEIYDSIEQGWKGEVWVIYNGTNREAKTTWLSNNVVQLSFVDYNKDYYVTITKDGIDYTREDSYVEYII